MTNGHRRIPRSDQELNNYIRNTTRVLLEPGPPSGWLRLGLTEEEKDTWKALHDEWVAAYGACSNSNTRTKTTLQQKDDVRKRFTRFSRNPLITMSTRSTTTLDDRAVFRIPKRKATYTKRSTIDDAPVPHLQSMTGCWLKLRVRVAGAEGRPHIHRKADFLEVRYTVLPIGAAPPETWSGCPGLTIRTKAISVLQLPQQDRGKICYVFCRWVNSSDNTKSGPWSMRVEATVA